ncbi:acetate--CoA ligase family protein [Mesorhizobium sp. M0118]|uniref:acetate--CoA ligase family protein n=1 Tax=Mesorhizobium sp. M0118 TaxID=2956884 RepID=UPI003339D708
MNFFDRISLFSEPVVAKPLDRGVCVIAQSGTVACNVLFSQRHLPLGYVFSTGNQSSITSIDLAHFALRDSRVSAIGIYMESVGAPTALRDLACAARNQGVPIVVLKTGRSEAARSITLSHTGAMSGSDRNLDVLMQRLGIGRCDSLAEFVETLKLLHVHGPLSGNRLALSGGSGGDMAIASDLLQKLDVQLPDVGKETRIKLGQLLGNQVSIGNPFDFQTRTWHDEANLCQMFSAIQDGDADLYGFFLDHPDSSSIEHLEPYELPVRAFLAATRQTGAKAFVASTMAESTPSSIAEMALRSGVAPMQGMWETFRAFEIAHHIGSAWAQFSPPTLGRRAASASVYCIGEFESKQVLMSAGIKTPAAIQVNAKEAAKMAETIGYPVAMKVSSEHILHKTEVNGLALNVDTLDKALKEAKRLGEITEYLLIEEMIDDGVAELIIGAKVDPDFGTIVLVGAGGILAELVEDSVLLLPPFSEEEVLAGLKTLRAYRLLSGYRGRPKGDLDALISAVMAVAELALDPTRAIVEIEINPLIVRPSGRGAVAVDSLLICRRKE